jgi:outer membrane protein TolC
MKDVSRAGILVQKTLALLCATAVVASTSLAQANPANTVPNGPQGQAPDQPANQAPAAAVKPFLIQLPRSRDPLSAYKPATVPEPDLTNSPLVDQLVRDGKLYLSLRDSIVLALENNLDLAIARYNMPIADADLLRTQAGGTDRGVNTGVVQNTQGGGSAGGAGGGAGGTSGGAGGAGSGAGGLVQSTLGTGSLVSRYDPTIVSTLSLEHVTQPVYNIAEEGVPELKYNTATVNASYLQAFPTGTSIEFDFDNYRQTINSPYEALTPALGATWQFTIIQQLFNGFGFGPNLRYLHIAKNNKKISDLAFKQQVITTITQVEEIYWDLVNAYQDAQVQTAARDFAQKTLEDTRKQFDLQAVAAIDVMRAESEVAQREQDLTVAATDLQLQESLIKNAVTKSLDDAVLEQMPVVPTDLPASSGPASFPPVEDLINEALRNSATLAQSNISLQNQVISRKALRNNLLPTVSVEGYYGGTGLAGLPNPDYSLGPNPVIVPPNYTGALSNAYNNSSPTYYAGLNLSIPIRNRIAKADQFRAELEYRQQELYEQQLKKQIRTAVLNAAVTEEQSAARVQAAIKARDLAQRTFDIDKQEQQLGSGSIYQTLTGQRDLSIAQSTLVTAQTTYEKAKVDLTRATGTTLDQLGITIDEAKTGVVAQNKP